MEARRAKTPQEAEFTTARPLLYRGNAQRILILTQALITL